jgi:membrane glycosyltransferase
VLFIILLVPLILFFIVGAIVAVVTGRRSEVEDDERDRLVELKGIRNGAYVLGTGIFAAIACALLTDGNFWFVHVLFASLVISELVESASQLVYYRRGV